MPNQSNPTPVKSQRRKMSLERVMIMFTLFFIVGILLLVLIPEENLARGVAMALYSIAVFWSMFRFGI